MPSRKVLHIFPEFLFLPRLSDNFRVSRSEVIEMSWLQRLLSPRTCPECGGRLRKVIASNESFASKAANVASSQSTGFVGHIMFVPVYLECEQCEYRIRMRNIRARI